MSTERTPSQACLPEGRAGRRLTLARGAALLLAVALSAAPLRPAHAQAAPSARPAAPAAGTPAAGRPPAASPAAAAPQPVGAPDDAAPAPDGTFGSALVIDPEARSPEWEAQRLRRLKRNTLILAIAGAAALGVGIGLGVVAKQDFNTFDAEIRQGTAGKMLTPGIKPSENATAVRLRAERFVWGGAFVGLAGFVALDVAAFIYLFRIRGAEKAGATSAKLQVMPTPGGAQAAVSWRFW